MERIAGRATDRVAHLSAIVARLGGVARTDAVRAEGVSAYDIEQAVSAGAIRRVRRGWVATMGADLDLVRAALSGVVLTCITAAARLGLWVFQDAGGIVHVGASPHAGGVRVQRARVHWCVPPLEREPGALVDPVENVLAIVAACQPWERALAVWESALNKRLVTRDELARLGLPGQARRLLAAATPWADSGLETFVRVRLAWMRLPILHQVWIAGHRVDFLIGERLILQVDGGHHVGSQRDSDIRHDAELMLLGYHVIRVGYAQVIERWPDVQALIQRAVAQGLDRAR